MSALELQHVPNRDNVIDAVVFVVEHGILELNLLQKFKELVATAVKRGSLNLF